MKTTFLLLVLLLSVCLPAVADCPTTSVCPDDGITGNPTGRYKWQGSIQFAQFTHLLVKGGNHTWWEKCD